MGWLMCSGTDKYRRDHADTDQKCFMITHGAYSRNAGWEAGGAKREVSAQLLGDLEPGDYVMVHAGVAIAKITDDDEEETDQLMEELL